MTQPSKNGENAVDMLAVARIAQGVDIAGFAGPDAVKLVAPAKVNLFLDIGAKRADGYHEAVSIMHALMLHDVLRMKLAPGRGEGLSVDLSCVAREGLAMLDVPVESNIVAKAVRLLAEKLERTADETVVACLACRRSAYRGSSTKPGCRRGVFPAWRLRLLHGRGRCVRPCPCAHERQRRAREARGRRVHGCRVPRVRRASHGQFRGRSRSSPRSPARRRRATTSCPFPSTCFRRSWTSACGLASASTCSACSCRAAGRPCSCSAPRSPMQVAWPPRRACAAGGRVLPCSARRVRPWCRTAEISAARCIREI